MDFFNNEEKKMDQLHVKHVLSAQNNILSMSNNFSKQLDDINRMDRADCNIPRDDIEEVENRRRYDSKIVSEIAETVTAMRKEIKILNYKIQKLNAQNIEIANVCKEKHTKLNNQPQGRQPTKDQPSTDSQSRRRGTFHSCENQTSQKKNTTSKYNPQRPNSNN